MKTFEKLIKHKEIYSGKVLKYNVDQVKLPNGKNGTRETVTHPGGVAILAIKNNIVYLVKQYRYVFKKEIIEIPAGKLEGKENHLKAAKRELSEEIGAKVNKLTYLGEFYPSVGYTNEIIYLYFASDFEFEKQHLDEDEFINVIKMPLSQFKQQIKMNKIKDGKTIAAFHLYQNL